MRKLIPLVASSLLVATSLQASFLREKFTTDPVLDGWQVFGDPGLFTWDPANQVLNVTWNSSQTNSYYYHPLGATFTQADGFCVLFDLNVTNAVATGYFELAVGLCRFADVTGTNFSRANGYSPNLFEFDFFPGGPDSYGPSADATLVDAADNFYFAFDTNDLPQNVTYRVVLAHQPGASAISGELFTNGQPFRALGGVYDGGIGDFQLDTLAVLNYTTTDDGFGDALFAQGTIGNLTFASPLPVGIIQTAGAGRVQFASDTNWLYTLEQTTDLQTWTPAAPAVSGNGTNLVLQATHAPTDKAIYRVRADLP